MSSATTSSATEVDITNSKKVGLHKLFPVVIC